MEKGYFFLSSPFFFFGAAFFSAAKATDTEVAANMAATIAANSFFISSLPGVIVSHSRRSGRRGARFERDKGSRKICHWQFIPGAAAASTRRANAFAADPSRAGRAWGAVVHFPRPGK